MSYKIKPIRDLWFRFIRGTEFEGLVDAQTLAVALAQTSWIELVPHNSRPSIEHYRDTDRLKGADVTAVLKNIDTFNT